MSLEPLARAKLAVAGFLATGLAVVAFVLPATWEASPTAPGVFDVVLVAAFYAAPPVLGALELADAWRRDRSRRTIARGALGALALALGVWVLVVLQTTPGVLTYEGYGAFLGPVFSIAVALTVAVVVVASAVSRSVDDARDDSR